MSKYNIKFHHTEDSILSLCKVQYRFSHHKHTIIGYILCSLLLLTGVYFSESYSGPSIAFMLLACWGMVAIGQTPERTAKKIIRQFPYDLPKIDYTFDENKITANFTTSKDIIHYKDIYRLVEDNIYCYIILYSMSLYIFTKENVDNLENIQNLISKKTNKQWINRAKIRFTRFRL